MNQTAIVVSMLGSIPVILIGITYYLLKRAALRRTLIISRKFN